MPDEGLYEVDIGLQGNFTDRLKNMRRQLNQSIADFDLDGQAIMQLTDIDADMFTDIIALDKTRKKIIIHLFDSANSNYL